MLARALPWISVVFMVAFTAALAVRVWTHQDVDAPIAGLLASAVAFVAVRAHQRIDQMREHIHDHNGDQTNTR